MRKALNNQNKAPPRTEQDEVDDVISWYEKFKPEAGKRLQVNCTLAEIRNFDKPKYAAPIVRDEGTVSYRGRELIPIKVRTPSKKKHDAINQSDIVSATSARTAG